MCLGTYALACICALVLMLVIVRMRMRMRMRMLVLVRMRLRMRMLVPGMRARAVLRQCSAHVVECQLCAIRPVQPHLLRFAGHRFRRPPGHHAQHAHPLGTGMLSYYGINTTFFRCEYG